MPRVSRSKLVSQLFANVDPPGCWTWNGARTKKEFNGGYGKMHDGSNRRTHRVIWEALNGPIPNGLIVIHTCDNPPCVRPNHLALGTHKQNQQDKWKRGRGVIGHRGKIDQETADEIRLLYSTGTVLQRELGEKYGLNQATISEIVRNRSWKKE